MSAWRFPKNVVAGCHFMSDETAARSAAVVTRRPKRIGLMFIKTVEVMRLPTNDDAAVHQKSKPQLRTKIRGSTEAYDTGVLSR